MTLQLEKYTIAIDQVYSNTQVSTQVNTCQHESSC